MTRISLLLAASVSAIAMASAAQAADLIIEPAVVDVVETYDGSWDGFYLGVFTGYGAGSIYDGEDIADDIDLSSNWIGGVNAGFDFTLTDGLVVGIVGDVTYLGLDTVVDLVDGDDAVVGQISYDLYWGGSVRGKIGFDGGAFLPYLTAGVAWASTQAEGSGDIATGIDTATHVGWTAGAGVEVAVADNVSVDLLYKYTDYGTQDYTLEIDGDPLTQSVGITTNTITAGVNVRF